ncbi:MAG: metalloregulator ArsR/SmtB family transcription factor [Verrucomicrobiota bacterium]|nr:metalloregulator ArsR/SmtB family transcription factor [Verrucomicrobiota bacterium]
MKAPSKARCESRAKIVKALAHPSRILIADALVNGELCVNDLTTMIGADISTVSKHLSVMKSAGLLAVEKRGLNQYYRLRCPCFTDFLRCIDQIAKSM